MSCALPDPDEARSGLAPQQNACSFDMLQFTKLLELARNIGPEPPLTAIAAKERGRDRADRGGIRECTRHGHGRKNNRSFQFNPFRMEDIEAFRCVQPGEPPVRLA